MQVDGKEFRDEMVADYLTAVTDLLVAVIASEIFELAGETAPDWSPSVDDIAWYIGHRVGGRVAPEVEEMLFPGLLVAVCESVEQHRRHRLDSAH